VSIFSFSKRALCALAALAAVCAFADQSKTVIDGRVEVEPVALRFFQTPFGESRTQVFVITNTDETYAKTVYVSKYNENCGFPYGPCLAPPAGYDDFTISGDCDGAGLRPFQRCVVRVTFTPSGYGHRSAAILVNTSFGLTGAYLMEAEGPAAPVPAMSRLFLSVLILFVALAAVGFSVRNGRRDPETGVCGPNVLRDAS